MKTISLYTVVIFILIILSAVGGILVGLTVSNKSFTELIWLLYGK